MVFCVAHKSLFCIPKRYYKELLKVCIFINETVHVSVHVEGTAHLIVGAGSSTLIREHF